MTLYASLICIKCCRKTVLFYDDKLVKTSSKHEKKINITSQCRKHNFSSKHNFEVGWKKAAEAFLLLVGVKYKKKDFWWLTYMSL